MASTMINPEKPGPVQDPARSHSVALRTMNLRELGGMNSMEVQPAGENCALRNNVVSWPRENGRPWPNGV